jgi:hypothetical protein
MISSCYRMSNGEWSSCPAASRRASPACLPSGRAAKNAAFHPRNAPADQRPSPPTSARSRAPPPAATARHPCGALGVDQAPSCCDAHPLRRADAAPAGAGARRSRGAAQLRHRGRRVPARRRALPLRERQHPLQQVRFAAAAAAAPAAAGRRHASPARSQRAMQSHGLPASTPQDPARVLARPAGAPGGPGPQRGAAVRAMELP